MNLPKRRALIINCPFRQQKCSGATLVETVIALAISLFVIAGLVTGFVQGARQTESSAYVLAGQAQALQGIEQVRAAKWDTTAGTVVDQVASSNFPAIVQMLDVPGSSQQPVYGTNVTTITTITASPPLRMVRVDCSWSFANGRIFTNTVVTYRAPDQ